MKFWELYVDYYSFVKEHKKFREHIYSLREFKNERLMQIVENFDDPELQDFVESYPFYNLTDEQKKYSVSLFATYMPPNKKILRYKIRENPTEYDKGVFSDVKSSLKYKNLGMLFFDTLLDAETFISSLKLGFSEDYEIMEM